jgi:phytoene dehydrogenase-like protein
MTPGHYDAIIIGAGHNGLVAAAYLAKAKKSVLVFERRDIAGGTLVSEDFGGFKADTVQTGVLRPDILKDLNLSKFDWIPSTGKHAFISLLSVGHASSVIYGDNLVLDSDPMKAAESIKRFSEKDAARWPDFLRFMAVAARFLESSYRTIIPSLPKPDLAGALDLADLALDLRLAGRKDMLNIIRALAMSALELTEEYFESDVVRAAVASVGIHGVTLGPMSAGTSFNLIHNWMNRGGLSHQYIGEAGAISQALAEAAKAFGAEIRTNAEVRQITIKNMRATGVLLASGEEIGAKAVLSAADPKRTFLSLVGPMELPPEFVWKTHSIKMRGSVAKVHLGLDSLPDGMQPNTTYVIAPSIRSLEQAYDAAKYGEISEKPYLEVTTSENVVSVHFQFAPYTLKSGNWNEKRSALETLVMDTLSTYVPDLNSKIQNLKSLTPLDLEQTYALTEGDLNHGQLMLDQFFFMRPIPGYANHRTPIDGLYLCGSGVHGGGGISGIPGRNAAWYLLKIWK